MTTALAGGLELLERSLGYTRVVLSTLSTLRADDLTRATPCRDWDLTVLLTHMEDGLDAFTEAATGALGAQPAPVDPDAPRPARMRDKACALLGAWSGPAPAGVDVGGHAVAADLMLGAAALEITVHGWDVATALAQDHPVPEPLAGRLLDVALHLVGPGDRTVRFGQPRAVPHESPQADRLLAFLGR